MKTEFQPTILIDTREQMPWQFTDYKTEITGLPVGDYGIKDFSDWNNPQFIVERKSIDDLISSLTSGRPRFFREIQKMRQFRFRCLILECTQGDLESGLYRSAASPEAMVQSVASLQVRCNLHIIWSGTPEQAVKDFLRLVHQFCRGVAKDADRLKMAV